MTEIENSTLTLPWKNSLLKSCFSEYEQYYTTSFVHFLENASWYHVKNHWFSTIAQFLESKMSLRRMHITDERKQRKRKRNDKLSQKHYTCQLNSRRKCNIYRCVMSEGSHNPCHGTWSPAGSQWSCCNLQEADVPWSCFWVQWRVDSSYHLVDKVPATYQIRLNRPVSAQLCCRLNV